MFSNAHTWSGSGLKWQRMLQEGGRWVRSRVRFVRRSLATSRTCWSICVSDTQTITVPPTACCVTSCSKTSTVCERTSTSTTSSCWTVQTLISSRNRSRRCRHSTDLCSPTHTLHLFGSHPSKHSTTYPTIFMLGFL